MAMSIQSNFAYLASPTSSIGSQDEGTGTWTREEHERFLAGIALFPNGPWKRVAAIVKSRTVRQLRTHAQKYREKLARQERRSTVPLQDTLEPISVEEIVSFTKMIEPIEFSQGRIQFDDCLEFLVDALGDLEEKYAI
ncbi:hypothetical protein AC1031_020701 [Aphanomyces cochlioides]|nr:hypothetical protein AC1031_020701 [Aphanomyces cochlioides]